MSISPPTEPIGIIFVYDAFQPSQPAHHQIESMTATSTDGTVNGFELWARDGLPLLVPADGGYVEGHLLTFTNAKEAYRIICEYVTEKFYEWATAIVLTADGDRHADVLVAKGNRPDDGTERLQEHVHSWSAAQDPVFTHGLPTAWEIARPYLDEQKYPTDDGLMRAHFHLQAAHLLTWSAVERLSALMFGPDSGGPTSRVQRFGRLESWPDLVSEANIRSSGRQVFRSDERGEKKTIGSNGEGAWGYWYQVRSNLSHRGKSTIKDLGIVRDAFNDVHNILRLLLLHYVPDIREAWPNPMH